MAQIPHRTQPDQGKLYKFYRAGKANVKQYGERQPYGHAIENAATVPDLNPVNLQQARKLAKIVPSLSEFQGLIRLAEDVNAKIGVSVFIELLRAPRSKWEDLIRDGGKGSWGAREFGDEIRLRFPRPEEGRSLSRPRKAPSANRKWAAKMKRYCGAGLRLIGTRPRGTSAASGDKWIANLEAALIKAQDSLNLAK